jgi:hypothetical protein
MTEENLETLITLDDPGEEDLQVDTFDHSRTDGQTKHIVPKTPSIGEE